MRCSCENKNKYESTMIFSIMNNIKINIKKTIDLTLQELNLRNNKLKNPMILIYYLVIVSPTTFINCVIICLRSLNDQNWLS